MAETLLSPGVLARETDQSFIEGQPVQAGAAIIGPAVKGPVNIPTLVSSFSEYQSVFGGAVTSASVQYSYLTSTAANNYFSQGGSSLLVTRVVSGSFTPAKSKNILNADAAVAFQLATLAEGDIMNSISGSSGNLGTADNVIWEITSANTSSGTFSIAIRRGDSTSTDKKVLEEFRNVSLDPKQNNYISKVIGDLSKSARTDGTDHYIQVSGSYVNKSKFVRVLSVDTPTPDFFDQAGAAKAAFTGSIPAVGSGFFNYASGSLNAVSLGANKFNENISTTNIQGVGPADYNTAISLMTNKDDFRFNILSAPGLNKSDHATQITSIKSCVEGRQDSIAVIDLDGYGTGISTIVTEANGMDSSYVATYWPWLQTVDPLVGGSVWVPASTMVPGVYAFTDKSSDPWFAPAGITRGALGNVIRAERKLTAGNRDTLYEANVNPIATFPGSGVVVFGQKTLQKRASALDRVNVRRLLIAVKSFISQISDNLVFEQNSAATRNSFLTSVNPYLESVQQRQGLYAFKVVMDESNNTADVVDRNELVGQIFLQPTKTAEFIILDFNVTPTGASFPV